MIRAARVFLVFLLFLPVFSVPVGGQDTPSQPSTMTISVDASAPWKRYIPVRLTLHPGPGRLALVFPRWLPGSHSADALLGNFARLKLNADGKPLTWDRDPFDVFVIHADVPRGVRVVEADYDYVPARNRGSEVFFGVASGRSLAVLNPSAFALAPVGDPHKIVTSLMVRFPEGWSVSTALTPAIPLEFVGGSNTIMFSPTSLYTMIDSPIMAGSHHKTISLPTSPGDVPHTLELFADTDEILSKKEGVVTPLMTRLVAESLRMFGVRHYRSFRFMLALSTEVGRNGLEHHEGVAYVLQPGDLDDDRKQLPFSAWNTNLIPHEFVHSWNGKFRRPYGEDVRSNVAPQSSDLIWVYEGLTEYLGRVLMVRSGFRSLDVWRDDLTRTVSRLRLDPAENWQSLADTAIVASYTYSQGAGTSLRNVLDVYEEGALIWLEADAILRRESKGTKSLDDFCRLFFGGQNRGPEVVRYTRKDIVEALQKVQPYDWNAFIQTRLYDPPKGLPSAGLEIAGWKLAFTEASETRSGGAGGDFRYSLGASLGRDSRVFSVVPNSPAERAGLEEGMTILSVNGAPFSLSRLQQAVRATKGSRSPLELLVSEGVKTKTLRIEGVDGERVPTLTRIPDRPDLLQAIAASLKSP